MYLYKITNTQSGTIYIGVTKTTIKQRFYSHCCSAKRDVKSALYDAMRSYGVDKFIIEELQHFDSEEDMLLAEFNTIKELRNNNTNNYNIKDGGSKVFGVRNKESWKQAQSIAHTGLRNALGMKHTDENKQRFSESATKYWDEVGRYPKEVVELTFKEAHKLYGISKTHFYRLRNESDKE